MSEQQWDEFHGGWQAKRRCAEQNHAYKDGERWRIPDTSSLGLITKRNGVEIYVLRCTLCGGSAGHIPKHVGLTLIRRGWTIKWRQNNTADMIGYGPSTVTFDSDHCCVRNCRNIGVEWHHFAPRNVFPDAEWWPYLPVCAEHHQYWHNMMSDYVKNAATPEHVLAAQLRSWFEDGWSGER